MRMNEEYSWVPPGLSQSRIEEYMKQLPIRKVPRVGTDGEKYRERQLSLQLPKVDISSKYCSYLDPVNQISYEGFISARNDIALDVGHVVDFCKNRGQCSGCDKTLTAGSLAVCAPKLPTNLYHPGCFTCTQCQELLVDLTYCTYENNLYCERHYAERLKPRCGLCEELIFSGSYIRALNSEWHLNHFSCWHCDVSLNGKRYVLTDDHPCCISCYEENFTNRCRVCTNKIGLDSRDISYKDQHWHESCFTCFRCSLSLLEKAFAVKHEKSYCEVCYDREFSSRCESCEEVFQPGTRKIQYKSKQWHDSCFHCKVCKTKVGSKSFIIPNDKDIYCVRCFEDKIATKCTKCKNILTTGGVTFRNEPWHKECFVCVHCNGQLAGQKFASREDKPYCAVCFGELFAKRCASCSQPITGQGGTRFISFEGRHWHSTCFICALCQKSMAGKGFITDGEDIICPDCAKDKLMGPG